MIVQSDGFEFDFTLVRWEKYDAGGKYLVDGVERTEGRQSLWPGIDFVIQQDGGGWIWLECKNWERSDTPPRRRGGIRRSFLASIQSLRLWNELRDKFTSTVAFHALTGTLPVVPIAYIVLLESPKLDAALKAHGNRRMRERIPKGVKNASWTPPVNVVVLDVAEWNERFPQSKVRRL